VAGLYLQSRLEFLSSVQNADGGWGYFPGKASWLEPTAYAILALHGTAGASGAIDRAWPLVASWQSPDGSWRPSSQVRGGTWVTALALTLYCVREIHDVHFRKGIDSLVSTTGAESGFTMRAASFFHLLSTDVDVNHKAWPWTPGNASWIEPTAHTLVALKKVPSEYRTRDFSYRIHEGESMILGRRGRDGGWNCGNPNVLQTDIPSYPESTALAMLGLQGRAAPGLVPDLVEAAKRFRAQSKSPLANAWLAIALRCYGENPPAEQSARSSPDVMLAALEALCDPEGNYGLLQTP
jgi:hypothetical protein